MGIPVPPPVVVPPEEVVPPVVVVPPEVVVPPVVVVPPEVVVPVGRSLMVAMPIASMRVAPVGLDSMTRKSSVPSVSESLFTTTVMVLRVSPGANVSVPEALA